MSTELKELLNRAVLVAYWRDRDIDTEDGTFASTDTDEMIHLESAIQEFFGGMEANDLIGTGRADHYIDIAIKNHESTELEQLRKELTLHRKLARHLSGAWFYGDFVPETPSERIMLDVMKELDFYATSEDGLMEIIDRFNQD